MKYFVDNFGILSHPYIYEENTFDDIKELLKYREEWPEKLLGTCEEKLPGRSLMDFRDDD
jgi:hypothetical protein